MNNQINDMNDGLLNRFLSRVVLPMPADDLAHRILAVPYGTVAQDRPLLPRGSYLMFAVAAFAGIGAGLLTSHEMLTGTDYALYDTHPYMISAASILSKIFYM